MDKIPELTFQLGMAAHIKMDNKELKKEKMISAQKKISNRVKVK